MDKDCVLILSGGMDSTTMLHEYAGRIALAVSFDYGSNHNAREIEYARMNCEITGVEHIVIPLTFMGRYFNSSLLEGADKIPDGHYAEDNMKSTVVPFRNGIMLAVAAGLAESRGLKQFAAAMSEAMRTGTFPGITLLAPYTELSKGEIAAHGKGLGMDYSLTYSCYKGREKHCGTCGTCVERKEALAAAGIDDPTEYE